MQVRPVSSSYINADSRFSRWDYYCQQLRSLGLAPTLRGDKGKFQLPVDETSSLSNRIYEGHWYSASPPSPACPGFLRFRTPGIGPSFSVAEAIAEAEAIADNFRGRSFQRALTRFAHAPRGPKFTSAPTRTACIAAN